LRCGIAVGGNPLRNSGTAGGCLGDVRLSSLLGPQVLALVKAGGLPRWLGNTLGLAALFFRPGPDLNLQQVKGEPSSPALRDGVLSVGSGVALLRFLLRCRSCMLR